MCIALKQLGYVDTYHMKSVFENPMDCQMWIEAFEAKYLGKGKPFEREDWDQLLGHCQVKSLCYKDSQHKEPTNYPSHQPTLQNPHPRLYNKPPLPPRHHPFRTTKLTAPFFTPRRPSATSPQPPSCPS